MVQDTYEAIADFQGEIKLRDPGLANLGTNTATS